MQLKRILTRFEFEVAGRCVVLVHCFDRVSKEKTYWVELEGRALPAEEFGMSVMSQRKAESLLGKYFLKFPKLLAKLKDSAP